MDMYGLILRGGLDPQPEQIEGTAAVLGCTKYEARGFLVSKLPKLAGRFNSHESAEKAAHNMQELGVDCLSGEISFLLDEPAVLEARRINRVGEIPVYESSYGESVSPDPASVYLLLAGTIRERNRSDREETKIKYVPGSLVVGMPILYRKTDRKTDDNISIERIAAIYSRERDHPIAIQENQFDYTGLGPLLRPTRFENFQILVDTLKQRYPSSLFDDTLMRSGLPESTVAENMGFSHSLKTSSNREAFWRTARWIALFAESRPPV